MLVLGTRSSALALAQTRLVSLALSGQGVAHRAEEFRTTGDKRLDLRLSEPGTDADGRKLDKGLFTKELEDALLSGSIDLAVHSLKDLPTVQPPGLVLAAVLPRAAVADVLLTREPVDWRALGAGDVVATSSLRRACLLGWLCPGVTCTDIRGNVPTRLRKLRQTAEWRGILLAQAGLERLGYDLRSGQFEFEGAMLHASVLPPEVFPPAVGQAAIGLQARADDLATLGAARAIGDAATLTVVEAERHFLRALGGGCQTPLGVHAGLDADGTLTLRATVFAPGAPSGSAPWQGEVSGPCRISKALAEMLAADVPREFVIEQG